MNSDFLLPLLMGIGLATACGFRIFLPFLALCLAARGEYLSLPENFLWLTSDAAFLTLLTATILEIVSFYVPWLDNALDALATPVALVAGTMAIFATGGVEDMNPLLSWVLALITGGGSAMAGQSLSVFTRSASLLASGGLGNPLVSTAENTGSAGFSVAAIFAPVLIIPFLLLLLMVVWLLFKKRRKPTPQETTSTNT